MSVSKVGRGTYKVRWREGTRHRSKTVFSREAADRFDRRMKDALALGEVLDLDRGKEPLEEYVLDWWRRRHGNLSENTKRLYRWLLDSYIVPRIGHLPLRSIDVPALEAYRDELLGAGVGRDVVSKSLKLVHGILKDAQRRDRITANPAALVEHPKRPARKEIRPATPEQVEALRADLLERGQHRDATMVSVLAYAGLRPGEMLALPPPMCKSGHSSSTPARPATAALCGCSARSREISLSTGWRPGSRATRRDCSSRRAEVSGRRRRGPTGARIYVPAARRVGLHSQRPYDLRHAFASLLAAEGRDLVYIAAQLGHSVNVCASTYLHPFKEFEDAPRVPAEDRIQEARVPSMYPAAEATAS